jgi:hypothetical protein
MSHVVIKCAECRAALKVAERLLGTPIKCPKCKETFIAEVGDTYALADDVPASPVVTPKPDPSAAEKRPSSPRSHKPSR